MSLPKLPWFTGDVQEIASRLRAEVTPARPDGDCVRAVIYIEAITEHEGMSAARRARLIAAVIEAVQLVRGWAVEPAVADGPAVPVDVDEELPPAGLAPDSPDAVLALTGDAAAIAGRLSLAAEARRDSECVTAIRLIEAIHERGLAADETVRLTAVVVQAVRSVRDWAPVGVDRRSVAVAR